MKTLIHFLAFLTLSVTIARAAPVSINGAGATFPYPLYSKWFSEYQKVDPSVQINYQSVGSGAGIRQLSEKTIDFGASDSPMTDEQIAKAGAPIVHIPTVLGAVVLSYNLPGVEKGLKLTPEAVAGIYLGKITKWNDPAIAGENKGIALPDSAITVVKRSDGSGTTGIFTDYLSKVSPEFKSKVGSGTAVSWPVGLGGKGNEGVTGLIKQSPGSIGYVELIYAENNKLAYAALRNTSGAYVVPSIASVTAAAEGAMKAMPADFRISITNSPGKAAYPISGFTYLLVSEATAREKLSKLVPFLHWAVKDGQKFAEPLHYSPLPKALVSKVEKRIATIKTSPAKPL
jgi:phosphate transport system substrate-binding protein